MGRGAYCAFTGDDCAADFVELFEDVAGLPARAEFDCGSGVGGGRVGVGVDDLHFFELMGPDGKTACSGRFAHEIVAGVFNVSKKR